MGRHRTADEKRALAARAKQLRAAGRSRREIQAELGIGEDLATAFLRDVPLPDALVRPRAKDDLRAAAVELRRQGLTYDEISAELGVSKSSCSLWLRDLPRPEADPVRAAEGKARRAAALRARLRRDRDARDEQGQQVTAAAAASLGAITSRDLVLALAVSYWCEGAKRKPWNRRQAVLWTNSDPTLVTLFLEGLALLGVEGDRLSLRVHIHESADEAAAREWWSQHTDLPLAQFSRSTIKRHTPRTVRHNVGVDYHGCLCITVRRSRHLYQVLDGLVQGLARQPRATAEWQDDAPEVPAAPADEGLSSAVG